MFEEEPVNLPPALCFILALYKFFTAFRTEVAASRLASMLVRDGALFFIMLAFRRMQRPIFVLGYLVRPIRPSIAPSW